ncbi:MAG: hypothetical protein PHQ18_05570, partial [Patescibacteria group bacterium]|nr:hypothetical protein [Patescibacteria group bacterium]
KNEKNIDGNSSGNSSSNNQTETTNSIITNETIRQTAGKIIEYFRSQQDSEGKIIDGNITDWAIMSFGANGEYAEDISKDGGKSLLDYEKSYDLDDPSDLNPCTTYPRHTLALLATGVKKTDNAIVGLKDRMNNICYKNHKFGINGINDDIFGLIALLAIDTDPSSDIINDIVNNIYDWQIDNGAFAWPDWDPTTNNKIAGDDITGATINALTYAKNKGVNIQQEKIDNARSYLKTTQQNDGGWGFGSSDIMTTSWVMMGINALTQTQNDWFNSYDKSPWNVLVNNLTEDGYYTSTWSPVDWFGMKHAVPALLGKSWPVVLNPIVENFSEGSTFSYGGGGVIITNEEVPTSTEQITTSTPEIIELEEMTSSTPEIEILPVLLEAPIDEEITSTTNSILTPTPQTKIIQTNVEEVQGKKIDKTNTTTTTIEKENNSQPTENIVQPTKSDEKSLSTNKKVALGLGAASLLYGLFLLFKIFV